MDLSLLKLILVMYGIFYGQVSFSQNDIIKAANFLELGRPDSVYVDSTSWPMHSTVFYPNHYHDTFAMHFDTIHFEVVRTGRTAVGLRKVDQDLPWQALYLDSIYHEKFPPPFNYITYPIPLDSYRLWQPDPNENPDTVYEDDQGAHLVRTLKSPSSWIEASAWLDHLSENFQGYKFSFWRLDEPRIKSISELKPITNWKKVCTELAQSLNEDAWFGLYIYHGPD